MARRASWMALFLTVIALPCEAGVIADFDSILAASDPIQFGRLVRDGIPSDWSAPKAFPGIINPTSVFGFQTFIINVGVTPYIQIDFDEFGGTANLFASAYLNTYDPTSPATNYLGDAGVSGDYFGLYPLTFQVFVPSNQNLVVLVNDAVVGGGSIGTAFNVKVESFIDSNFTELPEPASWLLAATGLALLAGLHLRRRRAT